VQQLVAREPGCIVFPDEAVERLLAEARRLIGSRLVAHGCVIGRGGPYALFKQHVDSIRESDRLCAGGGGPKENGLAPPPGRLDEIANPIRDADRSRFGRGQQQERIHRELSDRQSMLKGAGAHRVASQRGKIVSEAGVVLAKPELDACIFQYGPQIANESWMRILLEQLAERRWSRMRLRTVTLPDLLGQSAELLHL
jgi:hypothetical protein